jgi:hypothetical protein
MGLRDDYVMAKKRDFEKKLREKVNSDPELKSKYGHIWDAIKDNLDELRKYIDESTAYTLNPRGGLVYFSIAEKVIKYAEQMKLSEELREAGYKSDKLEGAVNEIFPPKIDVELQAKLLRAHANVVRGILGDSDPLVLKLYGDKKGNEAAEAVMNSSFITSKEKLELFLKKNPEEILNSSDPFIYFIHSTQNKLKDIRPRITEINNSLAVLNQLLGEVAYQVYGDQIPPDATGTLRISDGRIEGYEYNGTVAPGKTTYYGLYDRWNSFNKKDYPWGLHPRFQKVPDGFDLSTNIDFASTNDIVGGNSGSSVINSRKEVVGLVFDGNLESLAGDFIFLPEINRTVAVDSKGLIETLKYFFKADRLIKELQNGRSE